MTPPSPPAEVVVTLGTDHHPFGRLVTWVDHWAAAHPEARCVIQHGTAPAPNHAEGRTLVPFDDLRRLLAEATVVVGHAGPGTVVDALAVGRLPVIVPRLAAHGEVVDDHQVAFARWMHERGRAVLVEDEAALHTRIDDALASPGAFFIGQADPAADEAVRRVGALIDGLFR